MYIYIYGLPYYIYIYVVMYEIYLYIDLDTRIGIYSSASVSGSPRHQVEDVHPGMLQQHHVLKVLVQRDHVLQPNADDVAHVQRHLTRTAEEPSSDCSVGFTYIVKAPLG